MHSLTKIYCKLPIIYFNFDFVRGLVVECRICELRIQNEKPLIIGTFSNFELLLHLRPLALERKRFASK